MVNSLTLIIEWNLGLSAGMWYILVALKIVRRCYIKLVCCSVFSRECELISRLVYIIFNPVDALSNTLFGSWL